MIFLKNFLLLGSALQLLTSPSTTQVVFGLRIFHAGGAAPSICRTPYCGQPAFQGKQGNTCSKTCGTETCSNFAQCGNYLPRHAMSDKHGCGRCTPGCGVHYCTTAGCGRQAHGNAAGGKCFHHLASFQPQFFERQDTDVFFAHPKPGPLAGESHILAYPNGPAGPGTSFEEVRRAVRGLALDDPLNHGKETPRSQGYEYGHLNAELESKRNAFICQAPSCWTPSWDSGPGNCCGKFCLNNETARRKALLSLDDKCGRKGCERPRAFPSRFCQNSSCRENAPNEMAGPDHAHHGQLLSQQQKEAIRLFVKQSMKTRAVVYLTDPYNPKAYPSLNINSADEDTAHSIPIFAAQHVENETISRVVFILREMAKSMDQNVLKRTLRAMQPPFQAFDTVKLVPEGPGETAGIYIMGKHDLLGSLSQGLEYLESFAAGLFGPGAEEGRGGHRTRKSYAILGESSILGHITVNGAEERSYGPGGVTTGDGSMNTTVHEMGHMFDFAGFRGYAPSNHVTRAIRAEYFRLLVLADFHLFYNHNGARVFNTANAWVNAYLARAHPQYGAGSYQGLEQYVLGEWDRNQHFQPTILDNRGTATGYNVPFGYAMTNFAELWACATTSFFNGVDERNQSGAMFHIQNLFPLTKYPPHSGANSVDPSVPVMRMRNTDDLIIDFPNLLHSAQAVYESDVTRVGLGPNAARLRAVEFSQQYPTRIVKSARTTGDEGRNHFLELL